MSKIGDVYKTIVTTVNSLLPSGSSYTRIPNVENLENNADDLLKKGFGIKYNGGQPSEGEFHNYVVDHSFSVVLSRELVKLKSSFNAYDTAVDELLEDANTIIKDFTNADEIGVGSDIRLINYVGTSPVENITIGDKNYKSIDVNFDVSISEDI